MLKIIYFLLFSFLITLFSCSIEEKPKIMEGPTFDIGIKTGSLPKDIDELSGLAHSSKYQNYFWAHNDSGDSAIVYLIDTTGRIKKRVVLENSTNQDWEDIAQYYDSSSNRSFIYIADIGDNFLQYPYKAIYRFSEDDFPESDSVIQASEVEKVIFKYPEGILNAETLLVDPNTGNVTLITKSDTASSIYELPSKFNWGDTLTASKIGSLPLTSIVAGDVSPDGEEIVIKTYIGVYYWRRNVTESLSNTLKRTPIKVNYLPESQEEAIAWDYNGVNFYVGAESYQSKPGFLKFFKRSKL